MKKSIFLTVLFLSCFCASLSYAAPKKLTQEERDFIQIRQYNKSYDEVFDIVAKNIRRTFNDIEEIDKSTGYIATEYFKTTIKGGLGVTASARKRYIVSVDKISDNETSVKAEIQEKILSTDNRWYDRDPLGNVKIAPDGTKEYNVFFETIEKGLK
jgi:hypothetical protein